MYQSAVEYYDSIGDRNNSDIYKQKMVMVFMKPHISKLFMDKKNSPKIEKKKSPKRSHPPFKLLKSPTPSPPRIDKASNEQSDKQLKTNVDLLQSHPDLRQRK